MALSPVSTDGRLYQVRLSPPDLASTKLAAPKYLHFVCSPTRALEIIKDIDDLGWTDRTKLVYEPIPDLCVPSEMPALKQVIPRLHSELNRGTAQLDVCVCVCSKSK